MRRGTDQDDIFYPFTDKHWATVPDAIPSSLLWTTSIRNADGSLFQFGGDNFGISMDLIRGSSGRDTITGSATNDFLVYNNGDIANGLGAFRSIENFSLGAGDDFLDLSAHGPNGIAYDIPVTVDASKGNDVVIGGVANDTILGGKGHDLLIGNAGSDKLYGGGGDDRLYGSDLMASDASSADWLFGEDGNDTLVGSASNDFLTGGEGDDVLSGGDGDDEIRGDNGNDVIDGGAGDDYLFAGDEDSAGKGNDIIRGGEGNDAIFGADGGFARLYGDAGSDHLVGGRGSTWYGYDHAALEGIDTVLFEDGSDRIAFEGLGITRYEAGGALGTVFAQDASDSTQISGDFVRLSAVTAAGEHLTIEVLGGYSISAAAFSAADFLFL